MPKQVKQTYNYLPNVLLNYSSDCSVSVLQNTGQITEEYQFSVVFYNRKFMLYRPKDFNLFFFLMPFCLLTTLEI